MNPLFMLVPRYAVNPILGLLDKWHFKLPLSFGGGVLCQHITSPVEVANNLPGLFHFNPTLMAMAVAFLSVDTITGIGRVLYEEGVEGIRSSRLRLAGWKLIEYAGVLFIGLVLTNGTKGTWSASLFSWMDVAGFLYVSLTESLSIVENITRRDRGAARILHDTKDMALGDWEKLLDRHVDLPNDNSDQ